MIDEAVEGEKVVRYLTFRATLLHTEFMRGHTKRIAASALSGTVTVCGKLLLVVHRITTRKDDRQSRRTKPIRLDQGSESEYALPTERTNGPEL
jgi:hypothetical protein